MSQQTINVPGFNAILTRRLSMAGVEAAVGDLSPELSPVVVLENDRPEWAFLAAEFLCAGVTAQLGAGGLVAKCQLRNPTNSGVLAVIESITVTFPTAVGDVRVRIGSATTDRTLVNQSLRDSRWAMFGTAGACKLSADNAAATGNEIERSGVLANTPYHVACCPIVLGPQSHVEIGSGIVDVEMDVSWKWRERPIGEYENKAR